MVTASENTEHSSLIIHDQKLIPDRRLAQVYVEETGNRNRQLKDSRIGLSTEFTFEVSSHQNTDRLEHKTALKQSTGYNIKTK